jgi:transcriptional regulator with XRE-family HTH domain
LPDPFNLARPSTLCHLDIERFVGHHRPMMLENAELWQDVTRQILRLIRGKRSQVAFSRRLGYRGNVAADWEGGHRAPTAEVLLYAMSRVGIDVAEGFESFHAASAPLAAESLHLWLDALRGSTPQARIAERSGFSRHQIRRWLSGEAKPRVPHFLRLVHALSGRGHDWVAAFVDIEAVPALLPAFRAAHSAARLVYDQPWAAALRMLIGSDAYRADPTDAFLGRALGISGAEVAQAVQALLDAGLVARTGTQLRSLSTFTASATASDADRRSLKAHWSRVALERLDAPREADLVSLNLMTLSRADLERVRQLQRSYFRELRALVASSEPEETAAVVLMQVISLTPDPLPDPS